MPGHGALGSMIADASGGIRHQLDVNLRNLLSPALSVRDLLTAISNDHRQQQPFPEKCHREPEYSDVTPLRTCQT